MNKIPLAISTSLLISISAIAQTPDHTYIVRTIKPERRTIFENVTKTGSLESPATVNLAPKLSGRLLSTALTDGTEAIEGTVVKYGEVIATLDSSDYEASLAAAEAAFEYAKVNLKDRERELTRTKALLAENVATQQEADIAETEMSRANAALMEAEAKLKLAKINVEDTKITAPMDGVISKKWLYPGTIVSQSTPIYTIIEKDYLKLILDVPTLIFPLVKSGETDISITVDAYPGEILRLKVFSVYPAANSDTRTVRLEVRIDNDGKYLPGMYATGTLELNKRDDVLVIPYESIVKNIDKHIVYKVENDHAVAVEIIPGIRSDAVIEIISGINEDDMIVSAGMHRLSDGASIHIEK